MTDTANDAPFTSSLHGGLGALTAFVGYAIISSCVPRVIAAREESGATFAGLFVSVLFPCLGGLLCALFGTATVRRTSCRITRC